MVCRILHVIDSWQRRGAEVFASQLGVALEGGGNFKNGICGLYGGGQDLLPVAELPVYPLGLRKGRLVGRAGIEPMALPRLRALLRQFRPQLIVGHGGDSLKYAALARLLDPGVSAVYRNIGEASYWNPSPLRVRLNRWLLGRMAVVVSVSQQTRQDFIRLYRYPPERVRYIPNGVDPAPFGCAQLGRAGEATGREAVRGEVRRELGLPPEAVVIIAVGNLSDEKGHLGLVELLAQPALAQAHLLLVGDGPLRTQLQERAGAGPLRPRVQVLGRRGDVPRLLGAADLMALPSRSEGMPGVLIEAGLAGLPSAA